METIQTDPVEKVENLSDGGSAAKDMRSLVEQFLSPDGESAAAPIKPAAPPAPPAGSPPAPPAGPPSDAAEVSESGIPEDIDLGDGEEAPPAPPAPAGEAEVKAVEAAEAAEEKKFQEEVAKFDPKQKEAILRERAANKALRTELKEYKAKVETLAKEPKVAPDAEQKLAALEARNKELEEAIGRYDLAQTEPFKQEYDYKLKGTYTRAIQLLVKEGFAAKDANEVVASALNAKRMADRDAILNNSAPGVATTLAGLLLQVDDLKEARATALKNWKATRSAQEENQQHLVATRTEEMIAKDIGTVIPELQTQLKNVFYVKSNKPEAAAWNAAVDARIETLKGVLRSRNTAQLVRLAAEGLTAPLYRKELAAARAKVKGATAERARSTALRPEFAGRAVTSLPSSKVKIEGASVVDAAKNFMMREE